MDKIELETIEFVNKGDADFDTKKQPVNASNLNQMQTNTSNALSSIQDNIGNALESINTNVESLNQEIDDKFIEKNYLCAKRNDTQTVGTSYETIVYDTVLASAGNDITLNSAGEFVIGDNIEMIEISTCFALSNYSSGQVPIVRIYKNSEIFEQIGISAPSSNMNLDLSIPSLLMPVTNGDVVKVMIAGNSASLTIRSNVCYVTIKSI